MHPKIDWNDSIESFVKIKLQAPQLLNELVHRELQYTKKKNYEKKLKYRRELYQEYSKQFKAQQHQFQRKTSFKRQIQRQIAKLALDISKILKELLKQESETISLKVKSQKDLNSQDITLRTKIIGEKQLSRESLIGEYVVIKQNLNNQIEDLINQSVYLKDQMSKLVNRKHLIQKELEKQSVLNMNLDEIRNIEQQLQKQRQHKIKLKNRIEYFSQVKLKTKKIKEETQILLQKIAKRVKDFSKQYKKIMETSQSRKNKKYNQFVKKYRLYNTEQENMIKNQYEIRRMQRFTNLTESIDNYLFKYQQPLDKMLNHINRKFTAQQFDQLNEKCQNIQIQIIQKQNQDRNLKMQIQSLKEHLLRKTKQLQLEYQNIRNR